MANKYPLYHNEEAGEFIHKLYTKNTPINKYQIALAKLANKIPLTDEEKECIKTLQELVDKETPMKVDKEDYMIFENVDGDYDYFPMAIHHYKCPNPKCKLHKKYEIGFEETRCPECNQLLDWR